jgi:hypothetical protein
MARIRTIKPEFPQSESMGRISRDARLLFIMMWTLADDAGRLRGTSRMLASLLFPYDEDAPKLIDGWLAELEHEKCIQRYTADGHGYAQILKWTEHQRIDKPSPSKIPPCGESSRSLANVREHSCLDQGRDQGKDQGSKDQGSEEAADADSSPSMRELKGDFDEWYKIFPRHAGVGAARAKYLTARNAGVTKETLLAGARAAAKYYAEEDKRFIPMPATWLHQERWSDDYTGPPPKAEQRQRGFREEVDFFEGAI